MENHNKSEIIVVGAGAIGSLLSWHFSKLGYPVCLVQRHDKIRKVLTFISEDGVKSEMALQPELPMQPMAIFLAVKAYDLAAALSSQLAKWPRIPKVLLANGYWENEVREMSRQPEAQICWATCTIGVSATSEGNFRRSGAGGAICIGPSPERPYDPSPELVRLLAAHGPVEMRWESEIRWLVRRKWLCNTVINTLCAIHEYPENGALLRDIQELHSFFLEAWNLGPHLFQAPWPFEHQLMWEDLLKLVENTRHNENSMARDRRLGRKTENAYLAGISLQFEGYPLLRQAAQKLAALDSRSHR